MKITVYPLLTYTAKLFHHYRKPLITLANFITFFGNAERDGVPTAKSATGTPFLCVPVQTHPWNTFGYSYSWASVEKKSKEGCTWQFLKICYKTNAF